MKEQIQKHFPASIQFPDELGLLCEWASKHAYPISGYFELRADDGDYFYHWFGSHAADDRLALFGAESDGSMLCIWRQDDGRQPIVHLGSEGGDLKVLAADMREFLVLLAIGYGEVGQDDLTQPPAEAEDINPKFQEWVESTFGVTIPETGERIQRQAQDTHQDFPTWVESVVQSGYGSRE